MAKVLAYKALNEKRDGEELRGVVARKDGKLQMKPEHLRGVVESVVQRAHLAGQIDHENVDAPEVFDNVLPNWGNGYQWFDPVDSSELKGAKLS